MRGRCSLAGLAMLGGCVAHVQAISEDAVVVVQEGVPDGDVLIKAREACALYGRVPVYVGVDVSEGFERLIIVNPRRHRFACVEPPAVETSLAEGGIARRWFENAQRQAAEKEDRE